MKLAEIETTPQVSLRNEEDSKRRNSRRERENERVKERYEWSRRTIHIVVSFNCPKGEELLQSVCPTTRSRHSCPQASKSNKAGNLFQTFQQSIERKNSSQ
jgi:hypothetical protein